MALMVKCSNLYRNLMKWRLNKNRNSRKLKMRKSVSKRRRNVLQRKWPKPSWKKRQERRRQRMENLTTPSSSLVR